MTVRDDLVADVARVIDPLVFELASAINAADADPYADIPASMRAQAVAVRDARRSVAMMRAREIVALVQAASDTQEDGR